MCRGPRPGPSPWPGPGPGGSVWAARARTHGLTVTVHRRRPLATCQSRTRTAAPPGCNAAGPGCVSPTHWKLVSRAGSRAVGRAPLGPAASGGGPLAMLAASAPGRRCAAAETLLMRPQFHATTDRVAAPLRAAAWPSRDELRGCDRARAGPGRPGPGRLVGGIRNGQRNWAGNIFPSFRVTSSILCPHSYAVT